MTSIPLFSATSSLYSTIPSTYRESVLDFHSVPKTFQHPDQLKFEDSDEEEDITSYYATTNNEQDDRSSSDEEEDEDCLIIPPRIEGTRSILAQTADSNSINRSNSQIRFQLPPKRSNPTSSMKPTVLTPSTLFPNPLYTLNPPSYSQFTVNERRAAAVPSTTQQKPTNPYANSLWYNTHGSFGNNAIDDIQQRVQRQHQQKNTQAKKRNIEEQQRQQQEYSQRSESLTCVEDQEETDVESRYTPPERNESLAFKRVDSPIGTRHFFAATPLETWDAVESVCPSPRCKGLSSTSEKYGKAVKELFDTEMKYAYDLQLIESVYRVLLNSRKYRHVISSSEELVIFSNVESITELSLLLVKQLRRTFRFEGDVFNPVVSISEIDLGQTLIDFFTRIKGTYATYFQTHEAQIATLDKCQRLNGPKYEKWLSDGSYLCKSQSDCWDLESLLVKPIQRVSKYLLLLNVLIESISDRIEDNVRENLYKAKNNLEKWLDELNCAQAPKSVENSTTRNASNIASEDPVKKLVYQRHYDSHQSYLQSINDFKTRYAKLQQFSKVISATLPTMIKFTQYHRHFGDTWHRFMDYEDVEGESNEDVHDEHNSNRYYILSVYASYSEKLETQESQTKLTISKIQEKIVKATSLTLETCQSVRHRIKTQSSSKPAYLAYLANPTKTPSKDVQEYITIQNQLQDELPQLNKLLEHFSHYVALSYARIISNWLATLAGDNQVTRYLEMLKSGELTKGDNFDIIEVYSAVKIQTKEALRDLCVDLNEKDISVIRNLTEQREVKGEVKISSSRVVRRLFGV